MHAFFRSSVADIQSQPQHRVIPGYLSYAQLELNLARSLHIQPDYIYRKMSYLKLLTMCHVLDLEEQDRQTQDRERRIQESMRGAGERFRRGSM